MPTTPSSPTAPTPTPPTVLATPAPTYTPTQTAPTPPSPELIANLATETLSPAPAPVARTPAFETCAKGFQYQNAEDVVPCFSQADCEDYDTDFGEPCCLVRDCHSYHVAVLFRCRHIVTGLDLTHFLLSICFSLQASRCICGSTVDAGGCAIFRYSGIGSAVTVPTVP